MCVWTNWGLTVNKSTETHVTDMKVGTKGGMGGRGPPNDRNGVRNLNKNSKSITKKKSTIQRKDTPKNSSRKNFLFKQGNILNYLEDTASVGGGR